MVRYTMFFIFLALSLSLVYAGEKMTITGIVQAVDWDENDEVSAVSIVVSETRMNDEGEEEEFNTEYYVDNDAMGLNLIGLVGHTVTVTGDVTVDEDETYSIHADKYKVLD